MDRILRLTLLAASLPACAALSGCLVVSYSSGSGWYIWPGSLIVTIGILVVYWLSRQR